MNELKPCPFCGGEAEICSEVDKIMGKFWYIRCKKCYCRGSRIYESSRELEPQEEYAAIIGAWEKAIEAWNRRKRPEPQKIGKWIIYPLYPDGGEDYMCSECGQFGCASYWNYCPNCGAKMEKENEMVG